MRVTFPRLPDHAIGFSVVERDDGVVYRLYGFTPAGSFLPHDLRHFIVERELGIADGIWGGIAAGAVFTSMRLQSGRLAPHAAERSAALRRRYRSRLMRAELTVGLVEAVAALHDPSAPEIRRITRRMFPACPAAGPGADPEAAAPGPDAVLAAAMALAVEAARWARLRPGEELVYEWRIPVPAQVRALRSIPRQREAPGRRTPRRW